MVWFTHLYAVLVITRKQQGMVSILDTKMLEVLEESSSVVGVFMRQHLELNIELLSEFHTRLGMFIDG